MSGIAGARRAELADGGRRELANRAKCRAHGIRRPWPSRASRASFNWWELAV
jgi:hypothetical protein